MFSLVLAAAVVAQAGPTPAPTPTPNPLSISGKLRSYYFTRQNASNNAGVQFDFTTHKCNNIGGSSTCVNQATLNQAIDLHADYHFGQTGWYIGGTYLYADPFNGPCSTAAAHAKGQPCVSQQPPNTNPDDTVPGFILNTFYEGYVGFSSHEFSAKVGDQLFNSPWAAPLDTRLKPAAFQGGYFGYGTPQGWHFELAGMLQWENRTSSTFQNSTLITSYPSGGAGLGSNILVPGCRNTTCSGLTTPGFLYGKVGYAPSVDYGANAYFWGVSNVVNMYWGDARYAFQPASPFKPYVALQGGWESNTGTSEAGKIASSMFGIQLGATIVKNVVLTGSFDEVPWHYDRVVLPGAATCSSSNDQIKAGNAVYPATNFAYFLPINAAQCLTNKSTGLTTIAYGGWASPYTDNYATNPVFTTQISQGEPDRRAPGSSEKFAATYTSPNLRLIFIASDAWYNYGNSIAPETTNEWNLDGTFRFSPVPKTGPYKGLQFRYRYAQRSLSNTFCGAWNPTSCPAGGAPGTTLLGGLPLFKYNRAMLEYDF